MLRPRGPLLPPSTNAEATVVNSRGDLTLEAQRQTKGTYKDMLNHHLLLLAHVHASRYCQDL